MDFAWGVENESAKKTKKEQLARKEIKSWECGVLEAKQSFSIR